MPAPKHLSTFRAILAAATLVWGSYIIALLRTTQLGISFGEFVRLTFVAFFFVGLPISVVFFDQRWRRILVAVSLGTALSLTAAEFFARAQEMQVAAHHGHTPNHVVSVKRWWPFESSSIVYSPERGWSGHD